MDESKDLFGIKKNFTAIALFLLIALAAVDILLRVAPGAVKTGAPHSISAVGHFESFPDGGTYQTYTIFEDNGDVYQCWYDQKMWNQKKVTNYKLPTASRP